MDTYDPWHDLKRRRRAAYTLIQLRKASGCVVCGENHPAAVEFHHKDPTTKEHNIAVMAGRGMTLEKIRAELEKCVVICANCHRKLHYQETVDGRSRIRRNKPSD